MKIAIISNYNMIFVKELLVNHDVYLITNSVEMYINEINPDVVVSYINDIFLNQNREYIYLLKNHVSALNIPVLNYDDYFFNPNGKMYYLTQFPFDMQEASIIAECIEQDIVHIQNPKKVIVLDADNTLWKGEIAEGDINLSEDGVGKIYRDFQKQLLRCVDKGAILCIVSKNYRAAVDEGINHSMFLIKDDIVMIEASFDEKYKAIDKIAKELNLGLESFIFVDDSPREINDVKKHLPMVDTFQVPVDIENFTLQFKREVYDRFFKFRVKTDRTSAYKNVMLRKTADDLNIKLTVYKNETSHRGRVAEMTMKTNQFNSVKKWEKMQQDNILTLEYEDDYGKEGIIGYIVYNNKNDDSIRIISMAMSCRVLARGVEEEFLGNLLQHYDKVYFDYIPTDKNRLVLDFCTKYDIIVNRWSNHNIKMEGLKLAKKDV